MTILERYVFNCTPNGPQRGAVPLCAPPPWGGVPLGWGVPPRLPSQEEILPAQFACSGELATSSIIHDNLRRETRKLIFACFHMICLQVYNIAMHSKLEGVFFIYPIVQFLYFSNQTHRSRLHANLELSDESFYHHTGEFCDG